MQRFDYICYHNENGKYVIDEFTLFATVIHENKETISYTRYQKFGNLKWNNIVTVHIDDFKKYYMPLSDEMYKECCECEARLGCSL